MWPTDRTLSAAITPGQREPRSNGNEGVLCITQNSSITRVPPSDCSVSYIQDTHWYGGGLTPLQSAVGVFYNPSQLGHIQDH